MYGWLSRAQASLPSLVRARSLRQSSQLISLMTTIVPPQPCLCGCNTHAAIQGDVQGPSCLRKLPSNNPKNERPDCPPAPIRFRAAEHTWSAFWHSDYGKQSGTYSCRHGGALNSSRRKSVLLAVLAALCN